MFAVIKTGGKQYRVTAEDKITVMTLAGAPGDRVVFDEVLLVTKAEGSTALGAPFVGGAHVTGEIVEQTRGPKVIAFKKRRRKNSRRKRGHRQDLTVVRITDIVVGDPGHSAKPAAIPARTAAKTGVATARTASGVLKAGEAALDTAEDIELIGGIGATYAKTLRELGITSWRQIATWTAEDVARVDAQIGGHGRIVREEWVEQARELLAGKPPRAKIDREHAKHRD